MAQKNKFGNTSSAVALATQMAMEHNRKILLLSTSLNDRIIKESFWEEPKNRLFGLITTNDNGIDRSGIEGLDRILRSNKISPEIITDYTRVILTNRLEVLLGVEGTKEQYDLIKEGFLKVIPLANEYYDTVIVDLDRNLGELITTEILKKSDVVVSIVSQRAKQIEQVYKQIKAGKTIKESGSIIAIGRYIEGTKYNAKNITRNILKKRETINTIPYNNLFFEATQEGKVIDLFLSFMKIKEKDANYEFVEEIKKLSKAIEMQIKISQMSR